jgi:cytoskeletal protein CcmA (bactofilin family)
MAESEKSIIASGNFVEGKISGDSDITVEGVFKGEMDLQADAVIGSEGDCEGALLARNITVKGKFKGNCEAIDCIVVSPGSHVRAELKAPTVSIEKGARFSGQIDMVGEND